MCCNNAIRKEGVLISLVVEGLRKTFGATVAVKNLSFEARPGHPLALLGGNGAGKTTTIRIVLGLLSADGGVVRINGRDAHHGGASIGYLPEERGLYPKVKVVDQLIYFAKLYGLTARDAASSVASWLDRLEVAPHASRRAEELSKGNQQKVQLIAALAHDPDIVILDEPFSGLDPVNSELLKGILVDLVARGKIILFSSHQMAQVEAFCEDICVLQRGEVVLQGKLTDIKRSYGRNRLALRVEGDAEGFLRLPGIQSAEPDGAGFILRLTSEDTAQELLRTLARADAKVVRFELLEPSLHEIFLEKVGS